MRMKMRISKRATRSASSPCFLFVWFCLGLTATPATLAALSDELPIADFAAGRASAGRVDALLEILRRPDNHSRTYARQVLLRLGAAAVPRISKRILDTSAPLDVRTRLARVLLDIEEAHRDIARRYAAGNGTERKADAILPFDLSRPGVHVLYVADFSDDAIRLAIEKFDRPNRAKATGSGKVNVNVRVYAPSGKLATSLELSGDQAAGDIQIPHDGERGVYRVEIHSGPAAVWRAGSSTGRIAAEVRPLIHVARGQGGPWFFRVPAECAEFSFTIEALDVGEYAAAVLTPDGKLAASTVFSGTTLAGRGYGPGCSAGTLSVRPPRALRGRVWSLVLRNPDDAVIRMQGLAPLLAMHPRGIVELPDKLNKPRSSGAGTGKEGGTAP